MHHHFDPHLSPLERQARRRASARLGWYTHAAVYVAVNIFLAVVSAHSARPLALFPALGWGLGLAIHGLVVWTKLSQHGFYDRMVERERAALERTQAASPADPW